jgi:hypothetical protein
VTGISRRLRDENGSVTVEFMILFPVVFGLFLATFELGMLLTRQVMLERGLDLATRKVRLGLVEEVTHDALKELICSEGTMIPDCVHQLRLEMLPVDPRGSDMLGANIDCVDRSNPAKEVREFRPGISNELMILRACALVDPYFPTNVLGFPSIPTNAGQAFGIIATTAFVIEPS